MSQLTRFDDDGIELVADLETGEAFMTQAGYTRMSELSKQCISKRINKRLQDIGQKKLRNATIDTPKGLQTVNLIPVKLCIEWAKNDNPELAETICEKLKQLPIYVPIGKI